MTAMTVLLSIAAIWQFYLFATFEKVTGAIDVEGGAHHFWWAAGFALIACVLAFLSFSVLIRYDSSDEMHITAAPPRRNLT